MAIETWRRVAFTSDAVTYQSPLSTLQKPEMLIVKRAGSKTQQKTQVSVVIGDTDVDGNPRPQNTILERHVRLPIVNDPATLELAKAVETGIHAHTSLISDLKTGLIPQDGSIDIDITRPA